MPIVSKKKILFFTSVLLFFHICSLNALPSVFVAGNVINIKGPHGYIVIGAENNAKWLGFDANALPTEERAQFQIARIEGNYFWLRSAKYPGELIRHVPWGVAQGDDFTVQSRSQDRPYSGTDWTNNLRWERLRLDNGKNIMTTRWDGSSTDPGGYIRYINGVLRTHNDTINGYATVGEDFTFSPIPVLPEPKPTAAALPQGVSSGTIVSMKLTNNMFLSVDSNGLWIANGATDSTADIARFTVTLNSDNTISFKSISKNKFLSAIPSTGSPAWVVIAQADIIGDFEKFVLSSDNKLYNIGMGAYVSNSVGNEIRTHRPRRTTDLAGVYFIARSADAIVVSIVQVQPPAPKAGTGAVWATLADGRVLFRENVTASVLGGTGWAVIGGTLAKIAMGWDSKVYGVQTAGQALERINVTSGALIGTDWSLLPGVSAASIAAGPNGTLWHCVSDGKTYFGVLADVRSNVGAWQNVHNSLAQISVGLNGHVFALSKDGKVLYRTGISSSNLKGTDWYTMPNTNFASIAAGPNGCAWALKSDQTVWFLKDSNATWEILENGNCFGMSISVGADGSMWLSQASGDVWMRGGITSDVPKGTFFSKISNGTDFNVVSIAVGPVAPVAMPTIAATVAPTTTIAATVAPTQLQAPKVVTVGELPPEGSLVAIKCVDSTCVSNGFYVYTGGERDAGSLSVLTTIGTTSTDPKAQFIIKNINKTDGSFRLVSNTGWYVQSTVCNIIANKDAKADAVDTKFYYDGKYISAEVNPNDQINSGNLSATTGNDVFPRDQWAVGKKAYWSVLWDWHSLRNISRINNQWYPATVNDAKAFAFEIVSKLPQTTPTPTARVPVPTPIIPIGVVTGKSVLILLAMDGSYLSAPAAGYSGEGAGWMVATGTKDASASGVIFTVTVNSDNTVSFKADNGKYLSALDNWTVSAQAVAIGDREKFIFTGNTLYSVGMNAYISKPWPVGIRTHQNMQMAPWVKAQVGDAVALKILAINQLPAEGSLIAIKSVDTGKYVAIGGEADTATTKLLTITGTSSSVSACQFTIKNVNQVKGTFQLVSNLGFVVSGVSVIFVNQNATQNSIGTTFSFDGIYISAPFDPTDATVWYPPNTSNASCIAGVASYAGWGIGVNAYWNVPATATLLRNCFSIGGKWNPASIGNGANKFAFEVVVSASAKAAADKAAADKAFADAVAKAIADKAAAKSAAAVIVNPILDRILSVGNKITIKCDASSKYVSLGGEGTEQDPWLTIMGIDPEDPACIWEVVKRKDNAFWLKSTKTGALVTTLPSTDTAEPFVVKTTSTVIPDDQSKCEIIENKFIQSYGPSFWNWFSPNYIRVAGSKPVNNVWSYAAKTDADSFTFALAPEPFVPPTDATVVFHPRISPYNIFAFSEAWKTNNPGYIDTIFSIAAKREAIIILSNQKDQIDGETDIRMITIGDDNNSSIVVRCGGISMRGKTMLPLSGGSMLAGQQQYVDFWLSYNAKSGLLNLGKGSAVNQNVLASWQDVNPIPISYIGFGGLISSSGSPVYYKKIAVTTPVTSQEITHGTTTQQPVTLSQAQAAQQPVTLSQAQVTQQGQGVQQTAVQTPEVPVVQMVLAKPILIPSSIPLADASMIVIRDKNNKLLKVGVEGSWCTFTGKDSFDPLCRFIVSQTDAPYFILKNNKLFLESIITTGDVAVGVRTSKNPLSDSCWLKRVGSFFIKSFKDEKDTRYYWKSVADMLQTTNLEKQPASFADADAFTISLAPPLPEANQTILDKLKKGSVITISYGDKLLKIGGEEKNIAAFVGTDVYDPACRFDVVRQEGSYFWLSNNNVLVEVTSAAHIPAFVIRTNMSAALDESTRCELVGSSNISTANGFWNMRFNTVKDTSRVRTNDENMLPATLTESDQFVIATAPAFPVADQTILADVKKGAIVTIANKNNKYLSVSGKGVLFIGVDPKNKACQFTIADVHDDVFRLTYNSVLLETSQFSFVLNPKASIENCWLTLVGRSYIKSFEYKKDQRYFWRSSGDVLTMGNAAMTDPATFSEAEGLKITVVQKAPVSRAFKTLQPISSESVSTGGANILSVGNTIAILCVDSGKYLMVGGLDADGLRLTALGSSKNDIASQFNIIKKDGDFIWLQSISTGLLLRSFPAMIKVDQTATIKDKDASFQIVGEKYIKGFLNLAGSYYEAFLNWRSDQELVNFANNTNPDGTYPPATIQDASKFSIALVAESSGQSLVQNSIVSFKHEKTGKYMRAAGLDADPTVVTLLGITKDDPDCRFKIVKKDGDLLWLQSMSNGVLIRSLPTVIKIDPTATINDKDAAFSFVGGKNIKGFLNLGGTFYDAFLRAKDAFLLVNYSNAPNPDGSLPPATAQDADVFIVESAASAFPGA